MTAGDDFRSEFSIRGSDSRHLGMSMDGIAIPWPLHAVRGRTDTGSIAVINSDALDRLTLESGSYAQRSGTRTGGWIDFSLRDGSRKAFDMRASASVTNASVLAEGPLAGGRGAWLGTVRRSYLNWLLHQIDPETDAAALGFLDSQSRVVFDLSSTQQLQMSVVAGRAGYDEHDETPGANSLRDADSHTVVVTAGLRSIVANTMLLQRVGYVSQGFDNTGEFSQPLGEGRVREWIYNVGAATRVSSRMLVEGGAEVRRQHESRVLRSFARQGSGVVPASEDAFDGDSWLPAAHAQLTWQVLPSLVVSPGVRVAHSSLVDEPTINPWMQVLWRHGRFDVKAGAGEYPQFPEFDQVLGASGTRTLGAERAAHVDLTLGATMGGLRWQAAGYYRRERDMIRLEDSEPVLFGDRLVMPIAAAYENALDGSARGVELSVEGRARALSGWISVRLRPGELYGSPHRRELLERLRSAAHDQSRRPLPAAESHGARHEMALREQRAGRRILPSARRSLVPDRSPQRVALSHILACRCSRRSRVYSARLARDTLRRSREPARSHESGTRRSLHSRAHPRSCSRHRDVDAEGTGGRE